MCVIISLSFFFFHISCQQGLVIQDIRQIPPFLWQKWTPYYEDSRFFFSYSSSPLVLQQKLLRESKKIVILSREELNFARYCPGQNKACKDLISKRESTTELYHFAVLTFLVYLPPLRTNCPLRPHIYFKFYFPNLKQFCP